MNSTPTGTAGKVTAEHLARTAFLYIRQSSLRQVLNNTESTQRQYALRQRAVALGWRSEQIVVIDSDQGQSGASAADREGFQQLVADIGLARGPKSSFQSLRQNQFTSPGRDLSTRGARPTVAQTASVRLTRHVVNPKRRVGREELARERRERQAEARKAQERADVKKGNAFLRRVGMADSNLAEMQSRRRKLGLTWSGFVEMLVMEQKSDELLSSVAAHLDASGLDLRAFKGTRGIVLHRHGTGVVVVCATHAAFADGHGIRNRRKPLHRLEGDFLDPGKHWAELRGELLRRRPSRIRGDVNGAAPTDANDQFAVEAFPVSVTDPARALAIRASERIRIERTVAFGHPVVLIGTRHSVRFDPVVAGKGPLQVAFHYEAGDTRIDGALRLKTPRDPLAIVLKNGYEDDDVGAAWVVALTGFAELTCLDVTEGPMPSGRNQRPQINSSHTRAVTSYGASATSSAVQLSPALKPEGLTKGYLASYVCGHRRRLAIGHRPTDAKRAQAAAIGITLGESETWVNPHARGLPDGAELRFQWVMPAPLMSIGFSRT